MRKQREIVAGIGHAKCCEDAAFPPLRFNVFDEALNDGSIRRCIIGAIGLDTGIPFGIPLAVISIDVAPEGERCRIAQPEPDIGTPTGRKETRRLDGAGWIGRAGEGDVRIAETPEITEALALSRLSAMQGRNTGKHVREKRGHLRIIKR